MKLLRNILIIGVVTIILFAISIRLAEKASGDTVYIYMTAGVIVVLISRLLMNLSYWSSLKKDYNATPEELVNKSIKAEKYYVGEIFMAIVGVILFIYGYKEYTLEGFNRISITYFAGSIILLFLIIRNLVNKKSRIEKITNTTIPERNALQKNNKIMVYVVIGFILLSFLYKFFIN